MRNEAHMNYLRRKTADVAELWAADLIEQLEADTQEVNAARIYLREKAALLKEMARLNNENTDLAARCMVTETQLVEAQKRIQHLEFALADTEALELGTAEKLAASRAQIKVLREALEKLTHNNFDTYDEVAETELAEQQKRIEELSNQLSGISGELAAAQAEVAHRKNNHETEVRRARILKERTDMPIERVQAYEKWGEDQRQLAASQAHITHLQFALADTEALEAGTAERLAAAQAQIKVLREALEHHQKQTRPIAKTIEALALLQNDSALREMLRKEREKAAKLCEKIDVAAFGSDRPAPNDCAAAIRAMEDQ